MTELTIYTLFKDILKTSKVIGGRFHVATAEGSELNSNNLDAMVVDALGAITTTGQKYPLAMLMPPNEIIDPKRPGWSRFKLKMYFLTSQHSNNGQLKDHTLSNNTSAHTVEFDWKDMRECANDFFGAVERVLRRNGSLNEIRPVEESMFIERVTTLGNDKANGISVSFDYDIVMPCTLADYTAEALDAIAVNLTNIHPIHRH